MSDGSNRPLAAGLRLVWRRRSLLWWVFVVNIVLGVLSTLPAVRHLRHTVGHSLALRSLYQGFDLGMFYELDRVPEVGLSRFRSASYLLAGLFAVFMLFVSGGILETYRQDRRRMSVGDFFAASGGFFWRFVRLALISLIPFAILSNAYLAVDKAADYLGDKATADQVGFVIWLAGVLILVLLGMLVRLWFDVAKIRAVAKDERRMLWNTLRALEISRPQLPALVWMYLRISLVGWLAALIAFLIWMKLPPTTIWATCILLELVVLMQLGARLWQMASLTVWYRQFVRNLAAPMPLEVAEPEPQLSLYAETELPPADA